MASYKSIFFFIILFALILYGYFHYEHMMATSYIYSFIKFFLIIAAILSVSFPRLMDYLIEKDSLSTFSMNDYFLNAKALWCAVTHWTLRVPIELNSFWRTKREKISMKKVVRIVEEYERIKSK